MALEEVASPAPARNTTWIEWDPGTLTLIQHGAGYGRMIRLHNGELVCCFEHGGRIQVRPSDDEGKTWGPAVVVAAWPHGALANPELLQLRDGSVLCFYNERPNNTFANSHRQNAAPGARDSADKPADAKPRPFAISLSRSVDSGRSWSARETLYSAGTAFENGCWEPAAVELPSGEAQLVFANEGPYTHSAEQEITLLRSLDGARTWQPPETISFRAGHRDGMPVPCFLPEVPGVAMAIEDNGLEGAFKPGIVFSPLEDNWRSGPVGGDSPRRWWALSPQLPRGVYGGAPYLRCLPSGSTVLSFQQGDSGNLEGACMVVCLGDEQAGNFGQPTRPFPATPGVSQLWNSLFVKNENTLTAVSSTVIGGVPGLWSIEGRLRPSE